MVVHAEGDQDEVGGSGEDFVVEAFEAVAGVVPAGGGVFEGDGRVGEAGSEVGGVAGGELEVGGGGLAAGGDGVAVGDDFDGLPGTEFGGGFGGYSPSSFIASQTIPDSYPRLNI